MGNRTVRVVGGVLWVGTKGVNGMVWVSRAVRGGGSTRYACMVQCNRSRGALLTS